MKMVNLNFNLAVAAAACVTLAVGTHPLMSAGLGAALNPKWVAKKQGDPMPANPVGGGSEVNGTPQFVCRAPYNGGLHPGKTVADKCNITWGGKEIPMTSYEVLTGNNDDQLWEAPGMAGAADFAAGGENGHEIHSCRVKYYTGGWSPLGIQVIDGTTYRGQHIGKEVAGHCNIGYNGQEVVLDGYDILYSIVPGATISF